MVLEPDHYNQHDQPPETCAPHLERVTVVLCREADQWPLWPRIIVQEETNVESNERSTKKIVSAADEMTFQTVQDQEYAAQMIQYIDHHQLNVRTDFQLFNSSKSVIK